MTALSALPWQQEFDLLPASAPRVEPADGVGRERTAYPPSQRCAY
ncbi:hypothetical protein [Bosea sp. (in: a-proteobacteria)]|jgi:hypothetical protein|nr:hypothetical protein [Bosea sp. (in: a-proteobacteria)]